MMNLVALSLIATSIVVSGLFSPNPQNNGGKQEQVIVKEGHRAVVVEYDDISDGNTKVLISSQHPSKGPVSGQVDEQLSRATASVTGVAQDVKEKAHEWPHGTPRELICDAYGKCKHKIVGAWSKGKEKAAEAEEAVEEVVDKAKESAEGVRQNAKEKVKGAGETAERVKEKTGETAEKVKEKAGEAAEKVREKTGEAAGRMKGKTGDKVEKMKGKTEEMVEETGEMIKEKIEKGKKELSDIAKRGKEVILDAIWYVFAVVYFISKETLNSMISVTHLLGFATAYGISVWVTFIMSHVLAGVLPRQQFGMVQSKIYPVYFKMMVGSIGLALVGHLMGHRGKMFRNKADMFQGYNLLTSLLLVLGNLLFLEPRATKTMFSRMKLEKEEGRGRSHVNAPPTRNIDTVVDEATGTATTTTTSTTEPTTTSVGRALEDEAKTKLGKLDDRLKKLNSYSSLLNIMTLMGLTWHLVYLSQCLRANSCTTDV